MSPTGITNTPGITDTPGTPAARPTADATGAGSPNGSRAEPCTLEIVVPVYNEAHVLEASIRRLTSFLSERMPFSWRVTIADNASTDESLAVAHRLEAELDGVAVAHLPEKGRGRALRAVWSASEAEVVAYMDVDLSTGLEALLPLVAPLVSGHSDLAIGTRLARSANVIRGPKRELISRCYNRLLHLTLRSRFSDAQCGFKAGRREAIAALLPHVEDEAWFFDTELLVLAERNGLRIHEIPVDWVDDPDSRVDVVSTALEDLRGIRRLARRIATGRDRIEVASANAPAQRAAVLRRQVGVFAVIGVLSTVAHLALFALLRIALDPLGANLLAFSLAAVGNTLANRRFTFERTGRDELGRHLALGTLVFAVGLAVTTIALAGLGAALPDASRPVELGVLAFANGLATLTRFVLLRGWVFAQRAARGDDPAPATGTTDQRESAAGAPAARPAPSPLSLSTRNPAEGRG